ncbi:hypothetical protein [Flavobacterium luteum]|uniref:Uncharacterized protein n=1 Tax=Flavobacterium luteum TaxID=2026654 RepID=A0A7J5AH18_9FLAO|nr:hypothetical protein [Flavobacterium luteum]KAB1156299.1 hypothetical protein F6464_08900 [Flavobacterium luteum]
MIGVIPNPKKTITVDFPIEKVKIGVDRISKLSKTYKFTKSNEVFNQSTFEATEFLSFGVYIDINLSSVNENRTEITVEIRRKIGSFDKSHEVTNANEHIGKILEILSKGITYSEEDFIDIKETESNKIIEKKKSTKKRRIIIWGIILIIIFLMSKWGPFYN